MAKSDEDAPMHLRDVIISEYLYVKMCFKG